MAQDDVDIRVRMRGAKQAERDARGVARGLDRVGASARRGATSLRFLKAAGGGIKGTLSDLGGAARRGGFYLGTFAATAGAFAVKQGLQFNASMEQNTVAFTNFLGSTRKAKAYLSDLYDLAAKTPFEFPDLTNAAVKLMGFGMSAKRTKSILTDLGDAIAGTGGGAENIDRAVLALGQMQAKGKVTMEELNQLTEARIPAITILKKELHLSSKEMAQLGREGIPASKAIPILQKGLREMFGGQAAKQAKTFNGQLSSMKDYLNQTLGTITKPGFTYLRDKVFPPLSKSLQDVNKTFQRTDLDFGEKLRVASRQVKTGMGPVIREVEAALREAHLGDKLSQFVEAAAPKIANAAAKGAGKAAVAFVHAWWHAGIWGKLFLSTMILSRLGVFRTAGRIAAERFVARFFPVAAAGMAAEGAAAGVAASFAGAFVAALPAALIAAGIAGAIFAATRDLSPGADRNLRRHDFNDSSKAHSPSTNDPSKGPTAAQIYGQRHHDPTLANDQAYRGYRGIPQPGTRPGRGSSARPRTMPRVPRLAALPRARGASAGHTTEVHTHVHLDGREVARSVERHQTNARNRK